MLTDNSTSINLTKALQNLATSPSNIIISDGRTKPTKSYRNTKALTTSFPTQQQNMLALPDFYISGNNCSTHHTPDNLT